MYKRNDNIFFPNDVPYLIVAVNSDLPMLNIFLARLPPTKGGADHADPFHSAMVSQSHL